MSINAHRQSVGRLLRFTVVLIFSFLLGHGGSTFAQGPVCGNYDGCDPVILKVRGVVRDNLGNPINGAVVTATENRRRDVGAVEFFNHCGEGLHLASLIQSGTSLSGTNFDPGSYEILFIVCAEDNNDFAADFDVCVSAPGFQDACLVATFDGDSDREGLDFDLLPTGKSDLNEAAPAKGLPAGPCGAYDDCNMVLLKVRGFITAMEGGAPITNAVVTGTLTASNDINAIQFYAHCGNGTHNLKTETTSTSTSSSSVQAGFYELLFAICGEDNNDVLPDEFDVDVDVLVSAPGFEDQLIPASFDEEDDRDDRDFALVAVTVPTETFTPIPTETFTPTPTQTQAVVLPTALNPNADVDGDGRIDHNDMLEVLNNWYRVVE